MDEQSLNQSLNRTDQFIVHLDILQRRAHVVRICILFPPPVSPTLQNFIQSDSPCYSCGRCYALECASCVIVGDGLYEKAYEIVAAKMQLRG